MSANERAAIDEAGRKAEQQAAPVPTTREEARRQLGWNILTNTNNNGAECAR